MKVYRNKKNGELVNVTSTIIGRDWEEIFPSSLPEVDEDTEAADVEDSEETSDETAETVEKPKRKNRKSSGRKKE